MKRRDFLKISGATMAGGMLSACTGEPERLIPFLIPPDDGSMPGESVFYAGVCRQCPAGCGTLVRVAEGRAKKLEGNPLHPVNRGKLCGRGQAAVQALYHPDRILSPLRRTGERGSGSFEPISWDEALSTVADRMKALSGAVDKALVLTPRLGPGPLGQLVADFAEAFSSALHVEYELFDPVHHIRASEIVFGVRSLPDYDLAETSFLLSFGADFLESGPSPVRYGRAFGDMRQGRTTVRGTFTYAGPRLSMTAASADRWLPVRPGTEGLLALGMVRVILEEDLHDSAVLANAGLTREDLLADLAWYDRERVSEETGVPAGDIVSTAQGFARIRPSLALAGDAMTAHSCGAEALEAVNLLNLVAGNVGRAGGVRMGSGVLNEGTTHGGGNRLEDALSVLREEQVRVAIVHGFDPLFEIPPATGFSTLFQKVPFVVSCASFMDETALRADLILPPPTELESWDAVIPEPSLPGQVMGVTQPAVRPLGDTKQFGDILLAVARKAGENTPMLAVTDYRQLVRETVGGLAAASGEDSVHFWNEILQKGGLFPTEDPGSHTETGPPLPAMRVPAVSPPEFTGNPTEYPFHLQVYPSLALAEGRVAHSPWLQELPDPMTTAVWDNWVEINPEAARAQGIRNGDLVEIESIAGTVQLPAVLHPGIWPDTVAIPLGRGHTDRGRYARGRGVNPLKLLAYPPREDNVQAPSPWGATRVRITRISSKGALVLAGHPEGGYRGELLEI